MQSYNNIAKGQHWQINIYLLCIKLKLKPNSIYEFNKNNEKQIQQSANENCELNMVNTLYTVQLWLSIKWKQTFVLYEYMQLLK